MKLYGGIDLHSNNSYIVLMDSGGTVVERSRVANEIGLVLRTLAPYREQIESVVVESTYNWYWLVDGLTGASYSVKLANPNAMQQYQGLKYSDDRSDARWLETGDISRFPQVGDYASYCRCVSSRRISNAKKKGENNSHNGNRYLAWAYVEAATYAARFYQQAACFVERKTAQVNRTLAIKALAHKLARACYYVLRDGVVFEPARLLGS